MGNSEKGNNLDIFGGEGVFWKQKNRWQMQPARIRTNLFQLTALEKTSIAKFQISVGRH